MYALLSRIPKGWQLLRKRFEEHVKKAGLAAVEKLVGERATDVKLVCPSIHFEMRS
jgi:cullin 1